MFPLEMFVLCKKNLSHENPLPIVLILPWEARGKTVRLGKTKGPTGSVLESWNGETAAEFDAAKVLRYILPLLDPGE